MRRNVTALKLVNPCSITRIRPAASGGGGVAGFGRLHHRVGEYFVRQSKRPESGSSLTARLFPSQLLWRQRGKIVQSISTPLPLRARSLFARPTSGFAHCRPDSGTVYWKRNCRISQPFSSRRGSAGRTEGSGVGCARPEAGCTAEP